ncbi:MAG TPA: cytidine deaminase [Bacteroidales bacterium]|nr:cytidine deaminase [Bacteroidales bacterium]
MEEHSINIAYTEFESVAELETTDRDLLAMAADACNKAYAPYSMFQVGAALLLDNGEIVCGNNQENAAYPSGLCAERVAMFAASARFPGIAFKSIAITAKSKNFVVNQPVSPCGACRQVMAEYEKLGNKAFKVILKGESGKIIVLNNSSALMPMAFNSSHLNPGQK